jgi:GT2 family glycosyltransferase
VELSIILVNYNGLAFLPDCLNSIRRFMPESSEVILVDNGSQDGSGELVERDFPWVGLLRSESNLGFTGGNNLAAERAQGKFLLLLNTDTVLLEPLAPAVQWLREHKEYGIVSIGMIDGEGKLQPCSGRFPSPARLILFRTMLIAPSKHKAGQASDVDWVQGSFLLIQRDLWQELGGLDNRYFMYVEDVDICRRALERNKRCALLPQMRYMHFGGFNASRFPDQVVNLARYVDLHMHGLTRLASKAVLLGGCAARVAWYGLRAFATHDEKNRILQRACIKALLSLQPQTNRATASEYGVRL